MANENPLFDHQIVGVYLAHWKCRSVNCVTGWTSIGIIRKKTLPLPSNSSTCRKSWTKFSLHPGLKPSRSGWKRKGSCPLCFEFGKGGGHLFSQSTASTTWCSENSVFVFSFPQRKKPWLHVSINNLAAKSGFPTFWLTTLSPYNSLIYHSRHTVPPVKLCTKIPRIVNPSTPQMNGHQHPATK